VFSRTGLNVPEDAPCIAVLSDEREVDLQNNAPVFECFPYACPEPVLTKGSF
jgi:hypothetical protein